MRRLILIPASVVMLMLVSTSQGGAAGVRPPTAPEARASGPDFWLPTSSQNAPAARSLHTVVWTGSEMIVWGGCTDVTCSTNVNSGSRYNPATDTWTPTSVANASAPRNSHTAVWTGSRMIIWGGEVSTDVYTNTGGLYNPATDSWTPMSTVGAPSARIAHRAVWTGSQMIVWGGEVSTGVYTNTGGLYDPATDTWTATSIVAAPDPRLGHSAVWLDNLMIVWGGLDNSSALLNSGGRYDPVTDTWAPTSTTNAPEPRSHHGGVATSSQMIVWGGVCNPSSLTCFLNTGGRYDPVTDTWQPTSLTNAPQARIAAGGTVWSGQEMIVWAGRCGQTCYLNSGGRYNPLTDTWTPATTANAPAARFNPRSVWADTQMITWGGSTAAGLLNDGGRYNPGYTLIYGIYLPIINNNP